MHKALFEKAMAAVETGADMKLDAVRVCDVCGCTIEGNAPDFCPLCGAKKEHFVSFE